MDTETTIEALEKRVAVLEALIHHRDGLCRAVSDVVDSWPSDSFSSASIRDAVYERFPQVRPVKEFGQVSVKLSRMVSVGRLRVLVPGAGPTPTIYERNSNPLNLVRPGRKRGHKPSGHIARIRHALNSCDLQDTFTVRDLVEWFERNFADNHRPPAHQIYPLLKSLIKSGEVASCPAEDGQPLRYARGLKVVSPDGSELSKKETSWRKFRALVKTTTELSEADYV